MKENQLVHNKDNSTRFFECDFDGGCGKHTLTVSVHNNQAHIWCASCGYSAWRDTPIALTNPSGSASFIGTIPGGRGL